MELKYIILMVSLCLASCSTNRKKFVAYSEQNALSLKSVVKNLDYKKDEFKKHIFITPISRFSDPLWLKEVNLKPYLAMNYVDNKLPVKRITITLEKDGWLFMNYIHFMCGGKDLKIHMNQFDINREVVYGAAIREFYDHALSEKEYDFLKRCNTTDKYRLYGKVNYLEKSFKPEEIAYFQEVALVDREIKLNGYRSIAKAKKAQTDSEKP